MGTTQRTRKSAEDRKREIVQAAIRLAGEIGPERVTTQQIADAVGVSQPAIFRHFPGKAELWVAVGKEIAGFFEENTPLPHPEAVPLGGEARLHALIEIQLRMIAQTPAIPAILFSRELHVENEALRQHFEQVMANRLSVFSTLVEAEIARGNYRETLDSKDAAALVLAAIQGVAMRWSLQNRSFDLVSEGCRLLFCLTKGFHADPCT